MQLNTDQGDTWFKKKVKKEQKVQVESVDDDEPFTHPLFEEFCEKMEKEMLERFSQPIPENVDIGGMRRVYILSILNERLLKNLEGKKIDSSQILICLREAWSAIPGSHLLKRKNFFFKVFQNLSDKQKMWKDVASMKFFFTQKSRRNHRIKVLTKSGVSFDESTKFINWICGDENQLDTSETEDICVD